MTSQCTSPAALGQKAMDQLVDLPFASDGLPCIGGVIKARPEHFIVEETLPYTACGEGEHVYVTFRRIGWNTADAARQMQTSLRLKPSDVGWGGRKDKTAVVVQTFSLRCGVKADLTGIQNALADLPFEILAISRHANKIKTGHVAANRFTIIVSQTSADALPRALAIADRLERTGVPNFYGPQRFGHNMQNIPRGFALMERGKGARQDAFLVSVVQSVLFNTWLKQRMQDGLYGSLLSGDLVKKTDTGGMFTIEDLAEDTPRFDAGKIVYTGPIYGYKMRDANHVAFERETALLNDFGLTPDTFRPFRAPGSRREAILRPRDLNIAEVAEGLCFSFTLPSGAYATTVLREFMENG